MSGKAAADGKAARPSVSGRKRADGGRSAGRGTAGKRRLWPRILALVVAVLVLAMVAVFSWNRWLRFDDARDFQGSWQMAGAASAVAIDGDVIRLTEDVAYAYRLDPGSKTLSFTFGMYSGKGRYRFSLDRQTLVIQDGDFSWFSTLTDDAVWTFQALVAAVQGGEPPLPEGYALAGAKNCVLTPHVAFLTEEAMERRAVIEFDNVRAWLGGHPQNVCAL